jgi:hypothetical protein
VKKATITSACECQARLGAELDEHRFVIRGWARGRTRRRELAAPAHSIDAGHEQFEVAWYCPFCNRNVLRSFDTGGLAYREHSPAASGATPEAS